jgi:hypothetical protein
LSSLLVYEAALENVETHSNPFDDVLEDEESYDY